MAESNENFEGEGERQGGSDDTDKTVHSTHLLPHRGIWMPLVVSSFLLLILKESGFGLSLAIRIYPFLRVIVLCFLFSFMSSAFFLG